MKEEMKRERRKGEGKGRKERKERKEKKGLTNQYSLDGCS